MNTCSHPKEHQEDYHDDSVVCNACNCVIEQYGKTLDKPCYLGADPRLREIADVDDNDINSGVWFKSSASGLLHRKHKAAGDIECVIIDGVWYGRE